MHKILFRKVEIFMEKENKDSNLIQSLLNNIEKVGNKLPQPAVIFLCLCAAIIVLSHVFYLLGAGVTFERMNTETYTLETVEMNVQSLLTADGIRFIFTSVVTNFTNFRTLGVVLVAMVGVGLAEAVGLIDALIRNLINVVPKRSLTFIIAFLGVLSSVATHAGYLVLIPLGAAIFYKVGRHPIAGLATAFAGVAAGFNANIFITPNDGMLTEITKEAAHLLDPNYSIDLTANMYFSIVSTVFVAIVCVFITEKFIEPRLGVYQGNADIITEDISSEVEAKGLRYALFGFIAVVVLLAALTLPAGAPLRHPETGDIIGSTPFMESLIFNIMLVFLVPAICFGIGTSKITSSANVVEPIVSVFSSLSRMIFLLLIVSQFIAYFNYSNLGTALAVNLAEVLRNLNMGTLPLLLMFIFIVGTIDFVLVGVIPKFAILAPIFVPLFMKLGVSPEAMIAAYRIADSPVNAITPLMPYFALIVTFAEKYDKKIRLGTIISTMLPYTITIFISWTALFVLWYVFNLPLGPNVFIHLP